MTNPKKYFSNWKSNDVDIYITSILASILLSAWVIATDDLINNDGYDYLTMALAVIQKGPSIISAQQLWPLPASIATTASVLHINLELAAYLLSTIAFIVITVAFLSINKELGGNRNTLIWSAIVILTLPYMNEGRSEILRDHIYWAAFLTAFLHFLRHSANPSWKHAISWNAAILIGGIFRTEGFIVMALLPFILLLNRDMPIKIRIRALLQAHTLTAAIAMIITIAGVTGALAISSEIFTDRIAVILRHIHQITSSIHGGLSEKADAIRKALLEPHAKEFDMPAVIGIMALIIVGKTIKTLTPLYTLLLLTMRSHTKLNFSKEHIRTIASLSLLILGILIGFVSYQYFLQARYTMTLSFMLVLPIPFILANLHSIWRQQSSSFALYIRRAFPVIALVIGIMAIDIVTSFSPSRSYVTEAATWFQTNIPAGRAVITNESSFPYYANRGRATEDFYRFPRPPAELGALPQHTVMHKRYFPNASLPTEKGRIKYAAVRKKKGRLPENWEVWLEQQNATLISEFTNRRDDGLQIYEIDSTGGTQSPAR